MAEHANLYRRAFYYDIALERDVNKEVEFIIRAYQHYVGRELQSVLDLACGPGYHARALAAKGLHATGVDLSKEMLKLAEKKSREEGLNIHWINADMRSFRLKNPVDMAICMFDSFDALLTNDDIVQNFRCIAENTNPGGLYLIDLTHLREVDYNHYGEFRYCGERNGTKVEIVWATNNPQYDLITGIAPVAIEIRVEDNGEKFVVHDTAKERLVDPQELILLAEISGVFDIAGWHGDYDLNQPLNHSPDSRRMICVLEKRIRMKKNSHSYLSPKLEARPRSEKGGYGVYTRQPIEKRELLSVWGGKVTEAGEFSRLTEFTQRRSIQVEEDLYLVPVIPQEPADFVNHCCDPNAGMSGQIALVAIRDIQAGEEICYDYAMSDGSPYDEFECNCGAPNCRGRVTGEDWRDAELQEKYAGYFSPYLQRRIDQVQVK